MNSARHFLRSLYTADKSNGSETLLRRKGFAGEITLPLLAEQFSQICYLQTNSLFSKIKYGDDISCTSRYDGQWLTRKDSPTGGPLVGRMALSTSPNHSQKEELFYLHESLGALGLTDDEYQISSSLVALDELVKGLRDNPNAEGTKTLAALLRKQLLELETHNETPTYNTGRTEGCYKWHRHSDGTMAGAELIRKGTPEHKKLEEKFKLAKGGNHIGGGGDPAALRIKSDSLLASWNYWQKKKVRGASQADYESFVRELLKVGIESLEEFANSGLVHFPIQIHFAPSKRIYPEREPRPAVYLYTEVILQAGPQSQTYRAAIEHILDHAYCTRLHKSKGCKISPITLQLWKTKS